MSCDFTSRITQHAAGSISLHALHTLRLVRARIGEVEVAFPRGASPVTRHPSLFPGHPSLVTRHSSRAFTLMELILIMAILAIAASITAPALANFFRGRTLDSEARRLLSLTRQGQSRSISEGIPMELWIDEKTGAYGLEAEPTFEPNDAKAVEITIDSGLQIEVANSSAPLSTFAVLAATTQAGGQPLIPSHHPNLPRIRFLPDGSLDESSPQSFRLAGRDGASLWVSLGRSRLNYEITRNKQP